MFVQRDYKAPPLPPLYSGHYRVIRRAPFFSTLQLGPCTDTFPYTPSNQPTCQTSSQSSCTASLWLPARSSSPSPKACPHRRPPCPSPIAAASTPLPPSPPPPAVLAHFACVGLLLDTASMFATKRLGGGGRRALWRIPHLATLPITCN